MMTAGPGAVATTVGAMTTKYQRFRKWAYDEIEPGDDVGVGVDIFLVGLIFVNILAFVLETVGSIHSLAPWAFDIIEVVSVVVFSIELVVRFWTAPEAPNYHGRFRFLFRPMMMIDILAVIPSLLVFLGVDLRFMRVLRMFRLLRLAKLARYMQAMDSIVDAVKDKKDELVASFAIMIVLLLTSSSIVYFVEHAAQPDKFSSIPAAMWWGVATLTTIGYGDVAPVTALGQTLGAFIGIISMGFMAIPTGLLAAAFMDGLKNHAQLGMCSHCGRSDETHPVRV